MLQIATLTHPGKVREINEDAVVWEPALGLLAVADGMGGHNAGEVASHMAVESLVAFLRKTAGTDDFTWPYGIDPHLSFTANRLRTAMKVANRRVYRASEGRDDYTGMGTTLIAGMVEASKLTFATVGDSRLYELTDGQLRQVSRDDSWITMLAQETGLPASEMARHPMRNVLTSVVGARQEVDSQIAEMTLTDGQMLVLCTDGLHGFVSDDVIASTLLAQTSLAQAAQGLIDAALDAGGKDNVTVLLGRYAADGS